MKYSKHSLFIAATVALIVSAQSSTVSVSHDTYVKRGDNTVHGNESEMSVKDSPAASVFDYVGFIRFDLAGDPSLVSACELRINVTKAWNNQVYYLEGIKEGVAAETFDEATLNFSNASSVCDGTPEMIIKSAVQQVAVFTNHVAGEVVLNTPELLSFIQADSNKTVSFIIRRQQSAQTATSLFATKEHATVAPARLILTSGGPSVKTDDADVISSTSATLSGTLDGTGDDTTDATVYWGTTPGGTDTTAWDGYNTWTGLIETQALSHVAESLTPDRLYFYSFYARNNASDVWGDTLTFMTAEAAITANTVAMPETTGTFDAFYITRPASAMNGSITITYAASGSATSGVHYMALPGAVTLAAGQTQAIVSVTTLPDWASDDDHTLTLTLTGDDYLISGDSSAASVTFTTVPIPYSAPINVWKGSGNASDAANWHLGHVPTETETVLLGEYSTADMTWDYNGVNGLTNRVATWIQQSRYTGRATILTTFPEKSTVFTQLVVTGDMTLDGGYLSHEYQVSNGRDDYRLSVSIGGDLTVGTMGLIDVDERGFYLSGPGRIRDGEPHRSAHGGSSGEGNATNAISTATYGSILYPRALGSTGQKNGHPNSGGGGAAWLEVAGATLINGSITAKGQQTKWGSGTGGSVYLETASLSGTGSINADGGYAVTSTTESGAAGGGGRVAVVLTSSSDIGSVAITAYGGSTYNGDKFKAGAGTVFIRPTGTLGSISVDNRDLPAYTSRRTHIPANWQGTYATQDYKVADDLTGMDITAKNGAWVEFTTNLVLNKVSVWSDSLLFLEGHEIKVKSFTHGGVEYTVAGDYLAADYAFLEDSIGTGKIVVLPTVTMLVVR